MCVLDQSLVKMTIATRATRVLALVRALIPGCNGWPKITACGSIHACGRYQNNLAAFGYILVQ